MYEPRYNIEETVARFREGSGKMMFPLAHRDGPAYGIARVFVHDEESVRIMLDMFNEAGEILHAYYKLQAENEKMKARIVELVMQDK